MNEHRVVITGIGAVTPLGVGIDRAWRGIVEEQIAVAPITRFDASTMPSRVGAQIDDFDPSDYVERNTLRRTDRYGQFAIAAAALAFDDAGLAPQTYGDEFGVYIGSALGGVAFAEEQHRRFQTGGIGAIKTMLALTVFGGAATANVSLAFDLRGPTVANGNSCAAGAVALGDAFRAVARGDVRAAIAGGVEAPLAPLTFGAFAIIRAMSERNDDPAGASRPFDRERDGFVMAEGGALLVLERYDDAVRRGARMYGEICGYGLTSDAHHMAAPRPDGSCASRAMRSALREAALSPGDVELINAHASSTPLNDKTETLAIKATFGELASSIPIVATKGQHGHALGASGAWEAAFTLLAMRERLMPRVVNHFVDDPECDLNIVRRPAARAARTALSNSFGFGGINAALAFRAVDA